MVTLTGTDIKINANSQVSIDTKLADIDAELLSQGGDITDIQDDITDIQGDITDLQTAIANVGASGDGLAYIVNGDTAAAAVPAGAYAFLKNNTHGLADGFYINSSSSSFPVSGGSATSAVFTSVSVAGALNLLNDKIPTTQNPTNVITFDTTKVNTVSSDVFVAGNVVTIMARFHIITASSSSVIFATIDEGYRPVMDYQVLVKTSDDLKAVTIHPDGTIGIYAPTAATFRMNATYIIP